MQFALEFLQTTFAINTNYLIYTWPVLITWNNNQGGLPYYMKTKSSRRSFFVKWAIAAS